MHQFWNFHTGLPSWAALQPLLIFVTTGQLDTGDLVSDDSPEYFSKAIQSDWTDLRLHFSLCIPKSILNLPIFLGHSSGNGEVPFSLTWWGWWSLLSLITFPLAAQHDSTDRQMLPEEKHLPWPHSLSCVPLSLDPFIPSSLVSHPKRTELANFLRGKAASNVRLTSGSFLFSQRSWPLEPWLPWWHSDVFSIFFVVGNYFF